MRTSLVAGIAVACICAAHPSAAQDKGKTAAAQLTSESKAALQQLYASVPVAKAIGPKAVAILVFPKVTKAGLGIGGQYGEGTLLQKGAAVPTTRRPARHSGCRQAARRTATRCSS